jgi:hypothetical protein
MVVSQKVNDLAVEAAFFISNIKDDDVNRYGKIRVYAKICELVQSRKKEYTYHNIHTVLFTSIRYRNFPIIFFSSK